MKLSGTILWIGLFLLFSTLGNLFLLWVMRDRPEVEPSKPAILTQSSPSSDSNQFVGKGEIFRKIRLDPSRRFSINVVYRNGQEVARYKNVNDQIFDMTGQLPDGRIEFANESTGTYGQEEYAHGQRHGLLQEYYPNGQLKREAAYIFGQLQTSREHFIDGILRMEEDYTDALPLLDRREIGIGRVYDRKGIIKYEWNLTQNNQERFNKAYNANGEWVQVNYFDDLGRLIKTEKNIPSSGKEISAP